MRSNAINPVVRLASLVMLAREPRSLATFWADALDCSISADDSSNRATVTIRTRDAVGCDLQFAPVAAPKAGQNRIHFDLTSSSADDMTETIDRLLINGAHPIDIGQRPEEGHVVLADPEGNELCVIEPTNRFLAGCPRLGAINCDGTAELGYFWSAALGWPLVWDQDEETAIQAVAGAEPYGPKITWSGPPLLPRRTPERIHFHVAPRAADLETAIDGLIDLGAERAAHVECPVGVPDPEIIGAIDPDGNPFCVVAA